MLDPWVKMAPSYAREQEQELRRNLHAAQKLIAVLDLDNTIVHSQVFKILPNALHVPAGEPALANPRTRVYHMRLSYNDVNVTKLRPFAKQFLRTLHPLYRIVLYTMGTRPYANSVLRILKQECPWLTLEERDIVARDEGAEHTNGKGIKTLR